MEEETPMYDEGEEVEMTMSNRSRSRARAPQRTRSAWKLDLPPAVPDEQLDQMMSDFEQQDQDALVAKTWSRIVVEKTLSKFKWYFPQKDDANAPSLSKAWTYFEHITLARHFVGETSADHKLQRAEPGETAGTELYSPWKTPESALNEWGIGIGAYFSTLRVIGIIIFIAGCINIPNIYYYQSQEYNQNGQSLSGIPITLQGSTICTDREWVACTDCMASEWDFRDQEQARYATGTDGTTYVLRTLCLGAQMSQGMFNWATLMFLIVSFLLLDMYQRRREVLFDEDKVTSTDYSIVVTNPPPDAVDPEEWRAFFEQFSQKQVTVCTVALDNDLLCKAYIDRRKYRSGLKAQLPFGIDMGDEDIVREAAANLSRERNAQPRTCFGMLFACTLLPILRSLGMMLPPETLADRLFKSTNRIKELQKRKYVPTHVFITFETEEAQRLALSALKVSKLDIWKNNINCGVPTFQGRILKVKEPPEPNAVRWLDLNITTIKKVFQRLITASLTFGIIILSAFITSRIRYRYGPSFSSPVISVFNFIIPNLVKIMMLIENHSNEGGRQASMYLKITVFRWVNTAVIINIVTPFTSTIGPDKRELLRTVHALMISELCVTSVLRLLDITGLFKKHILAPRARTQDAMNLNFSGTQYNLAERYTDLTKIMFLTFFYAALFPGSLFICAVTLFVQYWTDKFCLMRIWASAPFIGTQISKFSRRYFFSFTILAFAILSAYSYISFPYDNVCDPEDPVSVPTGTFPVTFLGGDTGQITVTSDTAVEFCKQNLFGNADKPFPFPPRSSLASEWLTDSQATLVNIYGITTLVLVIVYVVVVFGGTMLTSIMSLFKGMYKSEGMDQKIDFSTVQEIFAYVPQKVVPFYTHPLLLCDVDDIDQDLIGWNDPNRAYDYYNIIFDVPYPGMKRHKRLHTNTRKLGKIAEAKSYRESSDRERSVVEGDSVRPIFSVVKWWPPKWHEANKDDREDIPHNDSTGSA